jgi:hypothetical protein
LDRAVTTEFSESDKVTARESTNKDPDNNHGRAFSRAEASLTETFEVTALASCNAARAEGASRRRERLGGRVIQREYLIQPGYLEDAPCSGSRDHDAQTCWSTSRFHLGAQLHQCVQPTRVNETHAGKIDNDNAPEIEGVKGVRKLRRCREVDFANDSNGRGATLCVNGHFHEHAEEHESFWPTKSSHLTDTRIVERPFTAGNDLRAEQPT